MSLSSGLIWQIISFILSSNEYGCVYAWTTLGSGPAIDLQKMPILAKKIMLSDEAHFDLGGYVNKQNCRIWGIENSHAYIEKPTHPKWVTVWCGFWSRGHFASKMSKERPLQSMAIVIESCWMNFCSQKLKRKILVIFGFNRTALRDTHYRLCAVVFLLTKIEEENIGNIWFQQDVATWHTAAATFDVLRPVFKDCIFSRRTDVVWPPRSCDLTPLDYYLWGAVKDKC